MILEKIKEAGENIIDRVKNPAGGTLIIAWMVFNWRLVFTFFNFDENESLDGRLNIVDRYLEATSSWILIWGPISFSVVGTILFLLLQLVSLFIYSLFNKWGKPFVFFIVDRNKITDKSSYDSLKLTALKFQKDNEEIRSELVLMRDRNIELRKQHVESQQLLETTRSQFEDFKKRRIVFIDSFNEARGWWSINYWGAKKSSTGLEPCRIENDAMIFEISSDSQLKHTDGRKERGTGSYVDVIGGIFAGESYTITAKVEASPDSTIKFKLWIHDTKGDLSAQTGPMQIGDIEQSIPIVFNANETNAMRIHLHIEEGIGKLYVREIRVVRRQ